MNFDKVVAVDGPSGSGKSTITRLVAKNLGITYIDTGAMFRALGLCLYEAKDVDLENETQVEKYLSKINFQYIGKEDHLIEINDEDLTTRIREHHVSKLAQIVAKIPAIRTYLLDKQRELAKREVCIMEGRDIGSVVFPNSFCKLFLTASVDERAERRLKQLIEMGQSDIDFEQVKKDVIDRDESDMGRDVAPLIKTDDAIIVDSTGMTMEEVINNMCSIVKTRSTKLGIEL